MSEKHIVTVADAFEPKYRSLLNAQAKLLANAYSSGGMSAMMSVAKKFSAKLQDLMDKNHLISVKQGVSTVVVRNRKAKKSVTVEDSEDPEQTAEIAANFLKNNKGRAKDVGNTTVDLARQAVAAGVEAGLPPKKIANLIQDSVGGAVGDYRARMIARTETAAAYNYANLEQASSLEDSTGPLNKIWVAASDERVRDAHAEADGQSVPLDEDFLVGGEYMSHPGDPSADASEVINCRCTLVYEPQD